ncbi:MAG: DUF4864 domain-containing protein [Candidatus Omnitrophica bacterium]|nr:DUF4864 domain-containing protein [Candidatus Omnitrophota bacterium]MDD5236409.1 DUF4864 domain-containing protein [Candidatus Omnitrophota bacterium]MDD5610647.1 DUF4864 domain-containing protein [Candidatus Omnitrophota bacterium]
MPRSLKVILLLTGLVVALKTHSLSAAARPVKEHLGFLASGDVYAAYALTSREFKDALSLDEYKNFVVQFPFLTKNKGYRFRERSFQGNTGKVKVVLSSLSGPAVLVVFTLVKENGKWKIISIAINPKEL